MRADGRRLGRIIGQLDDLEVLLWHYASKEHDPDVQQRIQAGLNKVQDASDAVRTAVDLINQAKKDE